MADFCFQCNIDHGFGPYSDFDHLPDGTKFVELCEGCGPILVMGGECVDPGCRVHGRPTPGARERYEWARRYVRSRAGPMGLLWRLRDRLLGTPWDQGLIHEWRYRWNVWRHGDGMDEFVLPAFDDALFAYEPAEFTYEKDEHGEDKAAGVVIASKADAQSPIAGAVHHQDE